MKPSFSSVKLESLPEGHAESQSFPDCFSTVAAAHRHRLALKGKDAKLTYGELDGCANTIARHVLDHAPAGARVILYMNNGARAIAAMVGVLKAGAVYVPVDPTHPAARNSLIISDANAAMILTDNANEMAARSLARPGMAVLNLDPAFRAPHSQAPHLALASGTPACIIYTSGSTGKPKGVLHTHRSLLHIGYRRRIMQEIAPDDRMTMLYSCCVTGAMQSIYTGLLAGAALYTNNFRDDTIHGLIHWLAEEAITVYHSVPTVFRTLVQHMPQDKSFPAVRLIIFGGERTTRSDLDKVWQHFPESVKTFVGLDTTETGNITGWIVDRQTHSEGNVLPVGRAAPGMEVQVVDENGASLPPGVEGEVVVRSRYLSAGYWSAPSSTSGVFQDCPGEPGARIYHLGDLGVLSSDGVLRLTGRRDDQVGIRGFRVETGEIESLILQYPNVAQTAVVVQEELSGDAVLAAFVEPSVGQDIALLLLRKYLEATLPSYMVPGRYRLEERLPMTPTGKIDRKTLTTLTAAPVVDTGQVVPPRDALEGNVTALFSEFLRIPGIGLRTNFFEAGGTSLEAVRLLAEIEARLGAQVGLAAFFTNPTPEAVAQILRGEAPPVCSAAVLPLRPGGNGPALFFILGGEIYRPLANQLHPAFSLYTVMLQWENDILLGQAAGQAAGTAPTLKDLAVAEVEAILAFRPEGPYCLAGSSFGGKLAFQVAQELRARGKEVSFLAMFDPSLLQAPSRRSRQWLTHQIRLVLKLGAWQSLIRIYGSVRPRFRRWYSSLKWRTLQDAKRSGQLLPDAAILEKIRIGVYLRLSREHTYTPYDSNTVLFIAKDSVHSIMHRIDRSLGWRRLVGNKLTVEEVPGDHLGMLQAPNVTVLADKMNAHLEFICPKAR
ncbi:MAG: AMP-binding protein [Candidatus Hydrogenedentes bacterium]|nr:AMP-binding protein [Candidatus Hydrogenedentota bacterium]